jgi:tRNA threonylcarbamoyladenosine biosynthesis protein TsaB
VAATPDGLAIAIETSSRQGSVALVVDGVVIADETFPHGLQHAAGLLPIIDRLLRSHGRSPTDLQQVYLSAGPGSFTGLRIGVTLAKTIAFASPAVKLVAVPTASVLAENAPADARHLIVVLDAKRGQIFTARFERDAAGVWTVREPTRLDTLSAMLDRAPRPVHLLGEGIPYHRQHIPVSSDIILTDEADWRPRAQVVARIGTTMAAAGEFADPQTLTPIYIRKPEAEEKWELANPR